MREFENLNAAHIKRSNTTFLLILILETITFAYLYFLRYKNQRLPLGGIEFKTGNVISMFLFGLLIFFTIVSILRTANTGKLASGFLILISAVSLAALIYSDNVDSKESKITAVAVFILLSVFLLSSVIAIGTSANCEFKPLRTFLLFLFFTVSGILSVFLNVLNFSDDSIAYSGTGRTADSGIILGAAVWGGNRPSPVLKERILKGYELYRKGIVPKLVLTGGGSPNELTEGEVSKNELLKMGVDREDLFIENESSSTVEQVLFLRDKLYRSNSWDKVILISDNFHLMRSREICSFNNIRADCFASGKELTSGGSAAFCMKESLALIVFWISGI